ncbi:DUF3347 domain-containing protein [Maribacter litopenaei]|uniref:DUF3347 domain-containing protein n=1 Tax=Maribacter litopenaei TaxID=2976127 RepID=A0ABY5Y971_9FLAO|nr:DUF3347 domain-containing protein [Maribacter litopenaei]UWX55444.1 DUF3347 domain-containing protein [Maribacter litopenaei]
MKRVTMPFMATILIFSLSCKEEKKSVETSNPEPVMEEQAKEMAVASFNQEKTNMLFTDYQNLRKALVATAPDDAKTAAEQMKMNLDTEEKEISALADEISNALDVEAQREVFSRLTEKVEPKFKETIESGEIYKQFCPMAFEGKGAYWISDASEIRNPYFGDKMLTCGKVTETIN